MPGLPSDHLSDGASDSVQRHSPPRSLISTATAEAQRMPQHPPPSLPSPLNAVLLDRLNGNSGGAGDPFETCPVTLPPVAPQSTSPFGSGFNGSAESEHDLAAMVHDFMENGSCGSDFLDSSDGENGVANGPKLFESLQILKFNATPVEKEVLSMLTVLASAIKEADLVCLQPGAECKGGCIRRLLVKHLRLSGYDAAVCTSKWQNSGKVPGGEYEYIDIIYEEETRTGERLIVDIDFRSQFEIARPTHSYVAALKFLPIIFVGSEAKLVQILQVMAEAGKVSLRQNSMPLPPWRTLDYMTAKWMSPSERRLVDTLGGFNSRSQSAAQWRERIRAKQCVEQLRHLKLCIAAESDKAHTGKSDRNRALYLTKSWRSFISLPYSEKNSLLKTTMADKPD